MPNWAANGASKLTQPVNFLLLQEPTVLGYLAEAAASYGCSLPRAQQLQDSARLSGNTGGSALLWRLVSAINGNKGCTLSFLKSHLPADITYGQIKVRAECVCSTSRVRAVSGACARAHPAAAAAMHPGYSTSCTTILADQPFSRRV